MDNKASRRTRFEKAWGRIRGELVEHMTGEGMPAEAVEWYNKSLDYNVPGGKLNRGMSVVDTVQILKGTELTEEEYHKTAVLGWCVEMLQGFLLIADDIMDRSVTRRGHPCWYCVPGIGMIAINDAFMIEGAIYHLLKTHFRRTPYYIDILELFHDTTYKTEMGQLIDLMTAPEDKVDLSKFSLEMYHILVVYKTSYYSFYIPVALAMHMSGVPETYTLADETIEPYKVALSILLPLGEYYQIQDDYLDFAGTPEQLGKMIGMDIADNKCSWCINTALTVATPAQRAVLDANYGRKGNEHSDRVRAVFEEVGIREHYAKYESEAYAQLVELIAAVPESPERGTLKREIFTSFLDKIHQRTR
ncbi:isoprenoid synthase domain-containing protein [Mycena sp. CBHHK59/15]|nr:isoprenoid synthase domain-containing protein [Mycena sp. CBHHK59/15]